VHGYAVLNLHPYRWVFYTPAAFFLQSSRFKFYMLTDNPWEMLPMYGQYVFVAGIMFGRLE